MSSDTILKDASGQRWSFDNIRTQGYLDGHAPGAEAVAAYIKKKATEAFSAGNDKEAFLLRKLAEDIVKDVVQVMVTRAKEHEKLHPEKIADE